MFLVVRVYLNEPKVGVNFVVTGVEFLEEGWVEVSSSSHELLHGVKHQFGII